MVGFLDQFVYSSGNEKGYFPSGEDQIWHVIFGVDISKPLRLPWVLDSVEKF